MEVQKWLIACPVQNNMAISNSYADNFLNGLSDFYSKDSFAGIEPNEPPDLSVVIK